MIVQSENGRTDHIYSDLKGKHKQEFTDGSFTGTYGIASYQKHTLAALFLGNGHAIEKNHYKIECTDRSGAILVDFTDEGLWVDAAVPFTLHIPVPSSAKRPFQLSYRNTAGAEEVAVGQQYRRGEQFILSFSLPAGERRLWQYVE